MSIAIFILAFMAGLFVYGLFSGFVGRFIDLNFPFNKIPTVFLLTLICGFLRPLTRETQRIMSENQPGQHGFGSIITAHANAWDFINAGMAAAGAAYIFYLYVASYDRNGTYFYGRVSEIGGLSLVEAIQFIGLMAVAALAGATAGTVLSLPLGHGI